VGDLKGWFIQQGPAIFLMGLFVYGLVQKWWVMGSQPEEVKALYEKRLEEAYRDRDEWKGIALRGTDIADRAVNLAAKK
jgi:hypothetical protein